MLYEIAETLGNALCDCMVVEEGDPDETIMTEGFACYCEDPTCCVVIGWADVIPDMCCGVSVVLRNTDYGDQPVSAGPSRCWGPRVATFDLSYDVCQPALDTNEIATFNAYTQFLSAVLERANTCWACIKTIDVGGILYDLQNITAISPTNTGITFAVQVIY